MIQFQDVVWKDSLGRKIWFDIEVIDAVNYLRRLFWGEKPILYRRQEKLEHRWTKCIGA